MVRLKYLFLVSGLTIAIGAVKSQQPAPPVAPAPAQAELYQDVRVFRDYMPAVSDVLKINEMPLQVNQDLRPPVFQYNLGASARKISPSAVSLLPGRLAREPREELTTSYVRGYLGNYDILGGALYYNLVQNEKFALGMLANHESSWGQLTVGNNSIDAPYHDTNGVLYFRHFFNRKTLSLDLNFENNAFRYFGLNTIDPQRIYQIPRPGNLPVASGMAGEHFLQDPRQHATGLDINLGLYNHVTSTSDTRYAIGMGYSTFGNRTGINENQFRLNGIFDFPAGEVNFRVEAGINHASVNSLENDTIGFFHFQGRQQTLVEVNPAMVRNSDNFTLRMGLRLAAGIDDLEDNFFLSPDVVFNLTVAEEIISLEGGITGEIKPNTYSDIMGVNPFISPDVHVKTAFHGVRFFIGTKGNFSSTTSFSARVEYDAFHDGHFFVNRTFNRFIPTPDTLADFNNLFDVVYDDGRLLTVSGELRARFTPDFEIALSAIYRGYELDSLPAAWHKPNMELGLRSRYQVNRNLSFNGSVNILGGRSVSLPAGKATLDPVVDFNIGANYELNQPWHFFAEIRNLTASRFYRWYGYPMHGINARVGVGYRF